MKQFLKFGVSLAGIYDSSNYTTETLAIVKLIEELGFDSVWTGDSQMLHRDAYCDLTLWSINTSRIKLGPCVTNPFTRHPSVTASAILSIDELSHGRALLGIGAGDSSVRRIGLQPRPIAQLEEAVRTVRDLCEGRKVTFHGEYLKIRWGSPKRIPIYVAASGPKSLETAGKVGDGVIMHAGPSEEGVEFAKDRVLKGAKSEGRSLQQEDFTFCQFLFSTIDEKDRARAIRAAKPFVTWYLVNLPEHPMIKNEVLPEDVAKKIFDYRKNYYKYDEDSSHHSSVWESSVKESEFIPDNLVEKYAIAGTPEGYALKLKELESLGVTKVIFRSPYTDVEEFQKTLRLLAEAMKKFQAA